LNVIAIFFSSLSSFLLPQANSSLTQLFILFLFFSFIWN
jgi:hypothetical protein